MNRRRRGQGMTEYIILVGLVAFLLIAAVKRFGFSVNEAMQGSTFAVEAMYPPDPGLAGGQVDPATGGKPIGTTSRTGVPVYRVKSMTGNSWEYHTGAVGGTPWDSKVDGTIGPP